ncbi:hypothetical protein C5E14_16170, partial [Rathayibacter sp. AY1A1]
MSDDDGLASARDEARAALEAARRLQAEAAEALMRAEAAAAALNAAAGPEEAEAVADDVRLVAASGSGAEQSAAPVAQDTVAPDALASGPIAPDAPA